MSNGKTHKNQKPVSQPKCAHNGDAVSIGEYTIFAAGGNHLWAEDMAVYDLRVMLRHEARFENLTFGEIVRGFLWLPVRDYETVPDQHWEVWVKRLGFVYDELVAGKQIVAFCAGGHGRTGLFLASLLALAEPGVEDPVAELRSRYCKKAVETPAQEAQVKRLMEQLRGQEGRTTRREA